MTTQEAMQQLHLTGKGTLNFLTVDLKDGQQITLTREDVETWPHDQSLIVSVVLIGTVPFETRVAVDLMERARHYFELVRGW